jgi:outer membrane immunogenic protein
MSKSIKNILRILTICAAILRSCSLATPSLEAQSAGRFQTGIEYNYLRTNAPPGGCPCFSANGGDAWLGYRMTHSVSLVGEVAGQHASNINGSGSDLTLVSYLFGPSYAFYHYRHLVPFGEVLLGGAHADGSLAPSNNGLNGSSDDFALLTGGGLDLPVGEHLSLRAARVDYYLTTFANGVNGHQNNLRVSTGLVLSF